MKTKLFATLVLLTGINVLQAMESSRAAASAQKEKSTELQAQRLLQEFAGEYRKLLDEYPTGERNIVGPLGDWSKKVDNLSKTYLEKLKDIDPKAAENITKLASPWSWRAKATPEERSKGLLEYLKLYQVQWKDFHKQEFVNENSKEYFRNNLIRRLADSFIA